MAAKKSKDENPEPDPHKEIYTTRPLPVPLTLEEIQGFAKEAAEAEAEITRVTDEKKEAVAEFNGQIARARNCRSGALGCVRDGIVTKSLRCTTRLDFTAGEAVTTRDDTDEEIERRPFTHEERQMEIEGLSSFFDEPFMAWVQRTLKVMPRVSLGMLMRRFDLNMDDASALILMCEERGWVDAPKEGERSRLVQIFDPDDTDWPIDVAKDPEPDSDVDDADSEGEETK